MMLRKRANSDWIVPEYIIQELGPFDLDPCAHPSPPWPTAKVMVAPPVDGLAGKWYGRVWLYPPSAEVSLFVSKLAHHGDGVALLHAKTDGKLFHTEVFPKASAIMFLRGRVPCYLPNGRQTKNTAMMPQVLVAYGEESVLKLSRSSIDGKLVLL